MNVDGHTEAVGGDLHEGEVRPGRWLGNGLTPLFDGESEGAGARVVGQAAKDEAFESIQALVAVAKAREARAVGRSHSMLDHGMAKLRPIDGGTVDEPEQVPKSVGATLAVAAAVHHELPLYADGRCERFQGRWKLT